MTNLETVTETVCARGRQPKSPLAGESETPSRFKKAPTMSAAAIEEFLGLPEGAWKKRRLFVLRAMTNAHAEAGIPKGAQIIVEPGARTAPGRLVLVKDRDSQTIRRIDYDRDGRTVMRPAAPGVLPFPTEGSRKQVIGTIIGVLPRARVAARTIRPGRRPPTAQPTTSGTMRYAKAVDQADHEQAAIILAANMDIWSGACHQAAIAHNRGAQARWRGLAGRLRVLASCLEVAHQKTLYGALAREANRIVAAMRRELDRTRTPGRDHLKMLPDPISSAQTHNSRKEPDSEASSSDAAQQHCTVSPAPPLDTTPATMV
jgi:hypothetical protein